MYLVWWLVTRYVHPPPASLFTTSHIQNKTSLPLSPRALLATDTLPPPSAWPTIEWPNVNIRLTSTQCDLARLRQVGQFEGRDMAKSISAPFIECSASDGVNIDVAFRELVKLVRKDERVSPDSKLQAPPTCQQQVACGLVTRSKAVIISDPPL